MRRQKLLERVHSLVHTLLKELTLVEERSIGDVLEDVSVVNHFLEGIHTKNFFYLLIEALIVDKVWIHNDLVHQAFHDLLVLFLVEVLVVGRGLLLRWHIAVDAVLLHNFLDFIPVFLSLILSKRGLDDFQDAALVSLAHLGLRKLLA